MMLRPRLCERPALTFADKRASTQSKTWLIVADKRDMVLVTKRGPLA